MNLRFPCPSCDAPGSLDLSGPASWQCPACGATTETPGCAQTENGGPTRCALCDNDQLYRQKDFPQWLGMTILTAACSGFFVLAVVFYQYAIAWAVLLGSAAFDGLVYCIVGDVVICYRCGAQHRGVTSRAFDPFELAVAEKYRQERIRRKRIRSKENDTVTG